ncbi:MAG: phenylacetate-CoA oxygenase subunit PaaI [Dehalococcoidia bacterium]|nr:phenylacetate-CoA oxygenase subunit PaaI [Dehalococcoidia bacterium]
MAANHDLRGKDLFRQDDDARMAQRLAEEVRAAEAPGHIEREGMRTAAARYAAGEIADPESIPDGTYREALVNLLTQEADSELAGALGYVPCIRLAPTIEEYLAVAMMVKDEFRHARVCYKLLEHLDVDVDERLRSFDFALRVEADDLGTTRAAGDRRVNIFYYPINDWYDFIAFNVCMDRGAGHQLEDVLVSSYRPWARVMEGIFKEEMFHIAHGDNWVRRLAADPETKAPMQAAVDRWFPRTMNVFGRPQTARNRLYRELGLKARDNQEVREAFAADVGTMLRTAGLRLPAWEPDWGAIPEEAVFAAG